MTHDWPQMTGELAAAIKEVRIGAHDVVEALTALGGPAEEREAIDARTRELIALAIAVSLRSDSWIAYCAEAAARQGVTRAQVVEAVGVALYMAGEPSLADAVRALETFERFVVEV